MKKRMLSLLLALALCLGLAAPAGAAETDYASLAREYGLLEYTGELDDEAYIVRLTAAKLVVKASVADMTGYEEETLTEDCASLTAEEQDVIKKAIHAGIMTGVDEYIFAPNAIVNRAEMAVILSHCLNLQDDSIWENLPELLLTDIPEWAEPYVAVLCAAGIIRNEAAPFSGTHNAEWKDALEWTVRVYQYNHNIPLTGSGEPDPGPQEPASGGETGNARWALENGVLTISGSGNMADYESVLDAPWYSQLSEIKKLVVEDGVTRIGDRSLARYGNDGFGAPSSVDEALVLPASVKQIGKVALGFTALKSLTLPDGISSIEDSAFDSSSGLTLTFQGRAPTISDTAFKRCTDLTVRYPAGDSSWDALAGRNFGMTDGTVVWTPYGSTAPDTPDVPDTPSVSGKLEELENKSPEEVREGLNALDKEELKDALNDEKQAGKIFAQLAKLEEKAGIQAAVEVKDPSLGMAEDSVKAAGAALNARDDALNAKLVLDAPADTTRTAPVACEKSHSFSMSLLLGEAGASKLDVPILVTLPIPGAGSRPLNFRMWHFASNGSREELKILSGPARDGSVWTVSVRVDGFSDFMMTYDTQTKPDPEPSYSSDSSGDSDYDETPAVSSSKGGKVQAYYNGTVKITPNSGYEVESVTVNGKEVSVPGSGKLSGLHKDDQVRVTFVRTGGKPAPQPAPAPSSGFSDVSASDYFAEPVKWAVGKGITSGTTATTFSPNQECSTAHILTFLWRAYGSPEPSVSNPFSDVTQLDYYYKAALWAYGQGMISGTELHGGAPCTRAQSVLYQWIAAGKPSAPASSFADVDSGASYAAAVAWAVGKGVTAGTSATTFSPDQPCTRGQIMTFLYKDLAA